MNIYKNKIFLVSSLAVVVIVAAYFSGVLSFSNNSYLPSESPQFSESPTSTPRPAVSKVPIPTGDGRTTFMDEAVPWKLLLNNASCQLQGEILFLDHNTYNNQDALFIYNGVDIPGRNIFWTITPQDDLSVGPNIFNRMFLPNGTSLIGISLPENPKSKIYELTAKMQYGRLVDEKGNFVTANGNVKVFETKCGGKTTIVLP